MKMKEALARVAQVEPIHPFHRDLLKKAFKDRKGARKVKNYLEDTDGVPLEEEPSLAVIRDICVELLNAPR